MSALLWPVYEKLQLSCIKHREEKQIYMFSSRHIYAPPPSIARIASVRAIVSPGFEIKLAASVSCVAPEKITSLFLFFRKRTWKSGEVVVVVVVARWWCWGKLVLIDLHSRSNRGTHTWHWNVENCTETDKQTINNLKMQTLGKPTIKQKF